LTTIDSAQLRALLVKLLPGLNITSTPAASGQRAVYFADFGLGADPAFISWGNVVVKVAEQLSIKQIAYLQKEIEILNSLDSPFFPTLHYNDVFSTDPDTEDPLPNKIFVSIEQRIAAEPLTDCKARFNTEEQVKKLLVGLIDGLNLLWSRPDKIVHRDLKPANILIRADDSVVIIDLGIVRQEGAVGHTETHAPFGPCTPPYASPEQANNDKKNITFKSDCFTLGTIAYELLTGVNPYYDPAKDKLDDVLDKVRSHTPTTLVTQGKASQRFSDAIEKIMRKQPYERYRTPEFFRAALV
jgi:serine/threonine-protein kinase